MGSTRLRDHSIVPQCPERADFVGQGLERQAVVEDHRVGDGATRAARRLLRQNAMHRVFAPARTQHDALDLRALEAIDDQNTRHALAPVARFGKQRHVEDHRACAGGCGLRQGLGADQRVQDTFQPCLGASVGEGEAAHLIAGQRAVAPDHR